MLSTPLFMAIYAVAVTFAGETFVDPYYAGKQDYFVSSGSDIPSVAAEKYRPPGRDPSVSSYEKPAPVPIKPPTPSYNNPPAPPSNYGHPSPASSGYGFPPSAPSGYRLPPSAPPAYGYPPPSSGYGLSPSAPSGYRLPPPAPPAYGYPPPSPSGYGLPPSAPSGYGFSPPSSSDYGYPSASGYGYPPPAKPGYGSPPQTYENGYPSQRHFAQGRSFYPAGARKGKTGGKDRKPLYY